MVRDVLTETAFQYGSFFVYIFFIYITFSSYIFGTGTVFSNSARFHPWLTEGWSNVKINDEFIFFYGSKKI